MWITAVRVKRTLALVWLNIKAHVCQRHWQTCLIITIWEKKTRDSHNNPDTRPWLLVQIGFCDVYQMDCRSARGCKDPENLIHYWSPNIRPSNSRASALPLHYTRLLLIFEHIKKKPYWILWKMCTFGYYWYCKIFMLFEINYIYALLSMFSQADHRHLTRYNGQSFVTYISVQGNIPASPIVLPVPSLDKWLGMYRLFCSL